MAALSDEQKQLSSEITDYTVNMRPLQRDVFREGKTLDDVKEPVQKLVIERSWTAKQVWRLVLRKCQPSSMGWSFWYAIGAGCEPGGLGCEAVGLPI
jgi:hypothetical protein